MLSQQRRFDVCGGGGGGREDEDEDEDEDQEEAEEDFPEWERRTAGANLNNSRSAAPREITESARGSRM